MIEFGTKAVTLVQLYEKLNYGKILPQMCFTAREWENGECDVFWNHCLRDLENGVFIVRSSALDEDTATGSQAESLNRLKMYEMHRNLLAQFFVDGELW